MTIPTLEAVKAQDGRIHAMLSGQEERVLEFYRHQGRKYDVAISIVNKADPADLERARSQQEAAAIMKRANTVVSVTVGASAEAAWAERTGLASH